MEKDGKYADMDISRDKLMMDIEVQRAMTAQKTEAPKLVAPVEHSDIQEQMDAMERAFIPYMEGLEPAEEVSEEPLVLLDEREHQLAVPNAGPARPQAPSAEEQRAHELTHVPFAPWCETCVTARGRATPHPTAVAVPEERTPNPIVWDYAFFNEDGDSVHVV